MVVTDIYESPGHALGGYRPGGIPAGYDGLGPTATQQAIEAQRARLALERVMHQQRRYQADADWREECMKRPPKREVPWLDDPAEPRQFYVPSKQYEPVLEESQEVVDRVWRRVLARAPVTLGRLVSHELGRAWVWLWSSWSDLALGLVALALMVFLAW